ncbi:MAG: CotH kinase family protein [Patescibacteria group bacterium]
MQLRLSKYHRIIVARIIVILALLIGGVYVAFVRGADRVEVYRKYHSLIQVANKLVNVAYVPWAIGRSALERYDVLIKPEDLAFLNHNLPPLYQNALLTDEYKQPVPAIFSAGGKQYQAKVRYRGDLDNHWRDPQKSFFIDFKKDNWYLGINEIHLIIPYDRYYLLEELSSARARAFGLVVLPSKFVNLFINGKRNGVYWQVEGFGKEMLEKQFLPGDVNVYGAIDITRPGESLDISSIHAWRKYAEDVYSQGIDNYADLENLLGIVFKADDAQFRTQFPDIVNMEDFYSWIIVQNLMSSSHITGANMRMWFDPTQGKFRMIPWDVSKGSIPPPHYEYVYNPFISRVLEQPEFLHERNLRLWRYIGDEKNLTNDLKRYDELDELTRRDFYKDTKKVQSNYSYRKMVGEVRQFIKDSFYALRDNLRDTHGLVTVRMQAKDPIATLTITSDGFSSLLLRTVSFADAKCLGTWSIYADRAGDGVIGKDDAKIADFSCTQGKWSAVPNMVIPTGRMEKEGYLVPFARTTTLFIRGRGGDHPPFTQDTLTLEFQNAVTGEKADSISIRWQNSFFQINYHSIDESLDDFVRIHPQFARDADTLLLRGTIEVTGDIIIPKGTRLTIAAGTTMMMGDGASILSYSPVFLEGSAAQPIIFRRGGERLWGVLLVSGVNEESVIRHVVMEYGSEEYLNGMYTSGMLSFFYSPARIEESEFRYAQGDDGINIKYAKAYIRHNRFEHNTGDAIDLDVSDSVVDGNVLVENGNDGIDISSAKPLVINNHIERSGDKCISVGENSQAIIVNNFLRGCRGYGIGVKDLSSPLILNVTAVENDVGIGVYEKKEVFGGSIPRIFNSIMWGNAREVEVDEASLVEISHSIVRGGWQGQEVYNLDPKFDAHYRPQNQTLPPVEDAVYQETGFPPMQKVGYQPV